MSIAINEQSDFLSVPVNFSAYDEVILHKGTYEFLYFHDEFYTPKRAERCVNAKEIIADKTT